MLRFAPDSLVPTTDSTIGAGGRVEAQVPSASPRPSPAMTLPAPGVDSRTAAKLVLNPRGSLPPNASVGRAHAGGSGQGTERQVRLSFDGDARRLIGLASNERILKRSRRRSTEVVDAATGTAMSNGSLQRPCCAGVNGTV